MKKIIQGCFENKKDKKNEKTEFYNSIQDLVYIIAYWLQKSAWKNACTSYSVAQVLSTHKC